MRGFRFRPRFRLRTILVLVGLAAFIMTLEAGRQRRLEFRAFAQRLSAMEEGARVQAEAAASSAAYHRHRVARGGLDAPTAADWLARADRLTATADDWRKQAESFARSRRSHERAAAHFWVMVEPRPVLPW